MDKNTAKHYLPFVQALVDGKTIQYKAHPDDPWKDMENAHFVREPSCFRIKPEPQVLWVLFDSKGRRYDSFHEKSEAAKYSVHIEGCRIVKFVASED